MNNPDRKIKSVFGPNAKPRRNMPRVCYAHPNEPDFRCNRCTDVYVGSKIRDDERQERSAKRKAQPAPRRRRAVTSQWE